MSGDDLARERFRRDERRDDLAPAAAAGAPAMAVQVYQQAAIPTATGKFYACHPLTVAGSEVEGGAGTLTADTTTTVFVLVVGSKVPVAGDQLVARFVGYRWVADLMTTSTPTVPTDVGGPCAYKYTFIGLPWCTPTSGTSGTSANTSAGLPGDQRMHGCTVELWHDPLFTGIGTLVASTVADAAGSATFHLPTFDHYLIRAYYLPRFGSVGPITNGTGVADGTETLDVQSAACASGSPVVDKGEFGLNPAPGYGAGLFVSKWPLSKSMSCTEAAFGIGGTATVTGTGARWAVAVDEGTLTHGGFTYRKGPRVYLGPAGGSGQGGGGAACNGPGIGLDFVDDFNQAGEASCTGRVPTYSGASPAPMATWTVPAEADGSGSFSITYTAPASTDPTGGANFYPCWPDTAGPFPAETITWTEA